MSRMLFMGDGDMLVRLVMVVGPHEIRTPIGAIKLGHQGIHPSVPATPGVRSSMYTNTYRSQTMKICRERR
jgi:hypothetical protein